MTDAPVERKRKSTRFLILLAIAVAVVAALAWWFSRDSNDGPTTGISESGAPVYEGAPVEALGTGTTARDVPGAPTYGDPGGAVPAGDGVAEAGSTPGAPPEPGATTQASPQAAGATQ